MPSRGVVGKGEGDQRRGGSDRRPFRRRNLNFGRWRQYVQTDCYHKQAFPSADPAVMGTPERNP